MHFFAAPLACSAHTWLNQGHGPSVVKKLLNYGVNEDKKNRNIRYGKTCIVSRMGNFCIYVNYFSVYSVK